MKVNDAPIPEEEFTAYKDLFVGYPVPKQKKRPTVAAAIARQPKPTKMQKMQAELDKLAGVINLNPEV